MIVIYNCYGGTHSSVLTSAVHLGALPHDRIPSKQELLSLRFFNKLTYKDMGRLIFHGKDDNNNKIYTIGRGTSKALIPALENLTREFTSLYNINEGFAFVNTSPTVPISMTFGGFFSRGLKFDIIGVPLLVKGARKNYMKIVSLADKTRKLCTDYSSQNILVDIDQKGNLTVSELKN